MIWHFDNTQIYILGSVHVMRENDNKHLDYIEYIYNKVSKVIFETSLDFEQNSLFLYEGDKLSANISKTLYRDTKKAWLKYDLEYSELQKSKIWRVALSISFGIFNKYGYMTEEGIDKIIWDKSREDNKIVEWLETQSAGLACLDNSPIEEQQKMLTKTVRNKNEVIEEISAITESWNASDEERLSCILNSHLEELPTMYTNLITARNSGWINKFISALESGTPTLFVVGALHCVGTCSIQNMLLERHGYTSKIVNSRLSE